MTTSSSMKSSLVVVVVLLSAVVASHAHEVSCKNSCKDPIWLNGIKCDPGKKITLNLKLKLIIEIVAFDLHGQKHTGTYKCPKDVKELEFLYDHVTRKLVAKITGLLDLVGGLLHSLLGSLSDIFTSDMHY